MAGRCAEAATSALADADGGVLSELGDHPRAVRLPAAATRRHGGHPRPAPEGNQAERVQAAAPAAPGRTRFEAERVTGSFSTALKDHT